MVKNRNIVIFWVTVTNISTSERKLRRKFSKDWEEHLTDGGGGFVCHKGLESRIQTLPKLWIVPRWPNVLNKANHLMKDSSRNQFFLQNLELKCSLFTSVSGDFSPSFGNLSASSSLNTWSIKWELHKSGPLVEWFEYDTWLASKTGSGASDTKWVAAILSNMFTSSSFDSSLRGDPDFSCTDFAFPAWTQNRSPLSRSVWERESRF